MKSFIKRFIPKSIFVFLQPGYHYLTATLGALLYHFPSKELVVIGITGTKGKSSTAELVNAILEEAGYTTALMSTIRFKVGALSERNMLKMTMPGLFFIQKTLRRAVTEGCSHVVLEMTSDGVKQFRHKYTDLNALIFTNITPEHIESHGSFEKYLSAKLTLRDVLEHSSKKDKAVAANADDDHGKDFLNVRSATPVPFSLRDVSYSTEGGTLHITYKNTVFESALEGEFNVMNILAAIKLAEHLGIDDDTIKRGVARISSIRGRVEHVRKGQAYDVIVDYAHTTDSLEKLYKTFEHKRKVCVLGNTGGGRDTWKRPEMGRIAERYCDDVILTNEDPYDDDPKQIVEDMARGMKKKPVIIMDRREAIREALTRAMQKPEGTVVLITGKGTDPFIMGPRGTKIPWDDRRVVEEELDRLIQTTKKGA